MWLQNWTCHRHSAFLFTFSKRINLLSFFCGWGEWRVVARSIVAGLNGQFASLLFFLLFLRQWLFFLLNFNALLRVHAWGKKDPHSDLPPKTRRNHPQNSNNMFLGIIFVFWKSENEFLVWVFQRGVNPRCFCQKNRLRIVALSTTAGPSFRATHPKKITSICFQFHDPLLPPPQTPSFFLKKSLSRPPLRSLKDRLQQKIPFFLSPFPRKPKGRRNGIKNVLLCAPPIPKATI